MKIGDKLVITKTFNERVKKGTVVVYVADRAPHVVVRWEDGCEKVLSKEFLKSAPVPTKGRYAEYEENRAIFDAPVNFSNGAVLHLAQLPMKVIVSASPDSVDAAAKELGISGAETDYIRISADKTHGAKFDAYIADPDVPGIDLEAGIFLNPRGRYTQSGYQIGRKEFVLYALKNNQNARLLDIDESPEA